MLYLDNAATSMKKPLSVYKSIITNTIMHSANAGRGAHKASLGGISAIIDAQETLAQLFNIDRPQNIAFMQNATYALNTAISGTLTNGGHVIVTMMDHNSTLRPVYRYGNYTVVKADSKGHVDANDIKEAIRENTALIACTHASNVCGTVLPVEEIGKIARENNIKFLLDTAQTAGVLDIDVKKLNVDLLAFSGHKGLMGPLGTGGLYVKNPEELEPLAVGGTGSNSESLIQPRVMPDMLHSGTMNTPAIAALKKGAEFVMKHNEIGKHEKYLADKLKEKLLMMNKITVYGDNEIGTVAFNFDCTDSGYVGELLERKIALRTGYHCAPLAHKALGTEDIGCVRISFGAFSKIKDVSVAENEIYRVLKLLKG